MFAFLKALFKRYGEDNITARSAALAYFAVFSIGPLLFITLGILGLLLGSENYGQRLLNEVEMATGPAAAEALQRLVDNQYLDDKAGTAIFIGLIGLILAAIGVFGQLQRSLNDIFRVKLGPAVGWKSTVIQKLISLALISLLALLLAVSVAGSFIIRTINNSVNLGSFHFLITGFDFLISVVVSVVMLGLIYRLLPDVKLPWKILFIAASGVAILFATGTFVLSLIIGNNATVSAFGAAGSVVALLLWMYYSGLIIYLGAVGISMYAHKHSVKMVPRYEGEQAVMKFKIKEESLSLPLAKKARKKLVKGMKKGWDN